ncbi:MAG: MbcA/ParS/Xre antitoxin family protein [Syntrophomonadaceae bacterium]
MRKDARLQFLHFSSAQTLPAEHDTIFSEWLWFDRIDTEQPSLAEQYLLEQGEYLQEPLKSCLEALAKSHLSVYRVLESSDLRLQLRDIFNQEEMTVMLREAWDPSEKQILLMGRLVQLEGNHIFSGPVLMMEDNAGQEQFLTEHRVYWNCLMSTYEPLPLPLPLPAPILYGLFDHAFKKICFNLDDLRLVSLTNKEHSDLLIRLTAETELKHLHDTGEVSWFTLTPETNGYARLALGKQFLAITADIITELNLLITITARLLPEKPWQIVNSALLESPPETKYSAIWFMFLKDRQTEQWLNTPHTELDNKTPTEMLAEPDGRQRLLSLLDDFSTDINSEEEVALIQYMKTRIQ